MKQFGLYKKQKLCSQIAIDNLFSGGDLSRLAFPIRMVVRRNDRRHSDAPIAFLISIPKKRLRHAVDRVLMRRRIREAFRLNHAEFALPEGTRVDVAFIYVSNKLESYVHVERAMRRLLDNIVRHYAQANNADE